MKSIHIFKSLKNKRFYDFLTVLGFFAILSVLVLFFLRKSVYVYVTVKVSDSGQLQTFWYNKVPNWYLKEVPIGSEEKDLIGRSNIKVEDAYYYPELTFDQLAFVELKVRTVYDKNTKTFSYKGTPLYVGNHQVFKIGSLAVPGIIQEIGSEPRIRNDKKFIVQGVLENQFNEEIVHDSNFSYSGIRDYLADKVNSGLKAYDSKGNVIAVLGNVTKTSGKKEFHDGGSVLQAPDSERTNVTLEISIMATEIDGTPYFREEQPLAIGSQINLNFETFSLIATITDFSQQ